jgi:hypothetical protein
MQLTGKLLSGAVCALMFSGCCLAAAPGHVYGWQEEGLLMPEQAAVKMALDPVSEASSLAATNIVPFDKGSEKWVRFTVQVPQGLTGKLVDVPFERPVLRSEKSKGLVGSSGHRQVIKMTLCIGDQLHEEAVTLKSPGKKDYAVTLGRSSLQHLGAVDASLINTVKPHCSAASAK